MSRPGCARPVPSASLRRSRTGGGRLGLLLFLGLTASAHAAPPADQRLLGTEHLAGFGRELALGRFGAGPPQLVIAAPRQRAEGRAGGQLFLLPAGPDGLNTNAVTRLSAPAGSYGLGLRLAAGDVNGDGFDDLLVGALSAAEDDTRVDQIGQRVLPAAGVPAAAADATNAPALVHLFTGSPAGLGAQPAFTLRLPPRGAFRELRLAAGGDLDGDGVGDFAVGLPDLEGGAGEVWLFRGRRQGGWQEPDQRLAGVQPGESFGDALAFVGDVTGDGRADLLVGAPRWDGRQADEGRAVLYAGGPGGVVPEPVWEARCEVPVRRGVDDALQRLFGAVVAAAGDVNGDGFPDVLVTAPFAERGDVNEGLVFLYHGSPRGLGRGPATILEPNREMATLGGWAAGVGDVDGDGFDDVLAGAPELSDGEPREGAAFLFRGSPRGLRRASSWSATGDRSHEELGLPGLALGDVNGDGFADVAFSGRHGWPDRSPGVVRIHYGTPAGLRGSAALTTVKPWLLMADQEWRRLGLATKVAVLAIAGLGLLITGWVGQREWQRRSIVIIAKQTQAERERLARDVHDNIGPRMSRVSLIVRQLTRRTSDGAIITAEETQKLTAAAREMASALNELVASTKLPAGSLAGLVAEMTSCANRYFSGTDIACREFVPAVVADCTVPADVRRELVPALREALNNVLRHSQASEVSIAIDWDGATLAIAVSDNGSGFRPGEARRGNGLENMRERMRRLGGSCVVESASSKGTHVRLSVRLDQPARVNDGGLKQADPTAHERESATNR
jgi:signal transduction histidine kinase